MAAVNKKLKFVILEQVNVILLQFYYFKSLPPLKTINGQE